MREYYCETVTANTLADLQSPFMPLNTYSQAHEGLVIPCHDVFIVYQGAVLLIVRDNHPAKDILWPIGGRIQRGVTTEQSLFDKVKAECQLSINHIQLIGTARTYFSTEPFGHGRGTDTLNLVYMAKGEGKIKLDGMHSHPVLVKPSDYTPTFKEKLSPYIRDFMEVVMGE